MFTFYSVSVDHTCAYIKISFLNCKFNLHTVLAGSPQTTLPGFQQVPRLVLPNKMLDCRNKAGREGMTPSCLHRHCGITVPLTLHSMKLSIIFRDVYCSSHPTWSPTVILIYCWIWLASSLLCVFIWHSIWNFLALNMCYLALALE